MIYAVDIETYEWNEKEGEYNPTLNAREFTLGLIKSEKGQEWYFHEPETMWHWINNKIEKTKEKSYFYGHNSEYDWYGIAQNHLIEETTQYICFKPFIAIINKRGYFLDTMAFYRMSLKEVGQIIGLPKLEMPQNPKTIKEIQPYLQRDVDITLKAIQKIRQDINKIGFKPKKLLTAGQLAMTSFLTFSRRNKTYKKFMEYVVEQKQYRIIKSKNANKIRQAFRGGNNTAYQIGTFENATLLDINSQYPYAMAKMEFPNLRSEIEFREIGTEQLRKYVENFIGIAECTITAPNIRIGYLPIRYSGYQIMPTNKTLIGTWTFLELKKAQQLGYKIQKANWAITWKKSTYNPLKPFITEMYKIKQESKGKYKQVIKLIMNNLYGKFAQARDNKDYKIRSRADSKQYLEQGYEIACKLEDKYVLSKEISGYEPSYINPIISATITAYARDYLYKHIEQIEKEDLLYCDTDSLMIKNFEKYKHVFEIGEELGQWKIEAEGTAKILGEKRYYINEQTKISGLPKKQITKEIIDQEKDVLTQKMIGLKDALSKGTLEKTGTFTERILEMRPHCKNMIITPNEIDETIKMKGE